MVDDEAQVQEHLSALTIHCAPSHCRRRAHQWKTCIAAWQSAGDDDEKIHALSQINTLCKLMRKPEQHQTVSLSPSDTAIVIKHKLFHVLRVAKLDMALVGDTLLAECKRCIDGGDFDTFLTFERVLQTVDQSGQSIVFLAAKEKAAKGQSQFLVSIVKFLPHLDLHPILDYCKSAINQEASGDAVLSILKTAHHSLDIALDTYTACKAPKTKTAVLMAVREKSSTLPKTSTALLELLKKETVEANGEILASLAGRLLAQNPDYQKLLAESLKAARPKPFMVKAVLFAGLGDQLAADLKQLMAKEAKTPTSNDTFMTLVALLKDGTGASVAQRAGYFLNDQFVIDADGLCVVSVKCQGIMLQSLLMVTAGKGDLVSKAIDRLAELMIFGDHSVLTVALQSVANISVANISVKQYLLERILKAPYNAHTESRIRRILMALMAEESLRPTIFYGLLSHPQLSANTELLTAVQEPIDYVDALKLREDALKAALPFIDIASVEAKFFAWLLQLPSLVDEGHVKVWSGVVGDVPILPLTVTPTVTAKASAKASPTMAATGAKKPAVAKPDPGVEKQLEKEREMRGFMENVIQTMNKSMTMIHYLVDTKKQVVQGIEENVEDILKMAANPILTPVVGKQLVGLFMMIGGGRLVVCEGVRFVDWILTISPDLPTVNDHHHLHNHLTIPPRLPAIAATMATQHPGPAVMAMERIVATDDSIESSRGVLLFVQRHATCLQSYSARVLRVVCAVADRFETLLGECRAAVESLGSCASAVGAESSDAQSSGTESSGTESSGAQSSGTESSGAQWNSKNGEIIHGLLVSESEVSQQLAVLFCRLAMPPQSIPSALSTILFIHGVGEESGRMAELLEYLGERKHLQSKVSKAICKTMSDDHLTAIISRYRHLVKVRTPEGPKERVAMIDLNVEERSVLGGVLRFVSDDSKLPTDTYLTWFRFAVEEGLCDPSPVSGEAAASVFESCRHIIADLPVDGALMEQLLPIIEARVTSPSASVTLLVLERQDMYKTWLIVLMAILSRPLAVTDPRRTKIMSVLLESLSTPSETVQMAVADGMVPLVGYGFQYGTIYGTLCQQLTAGTTMAARRGAAFGLGALCKANGLQFVLASGFLTDEVLPRLAPTSNSTARQGALFAVEMMARYLPTGLFDPILPAILPSLLACFAEGGKAEIREAAMDATQAIMATGLSMHAVKMILPTLFAPLDNSASQWRSRVAALEWLGQMAGTKGRRALAQYLPQIVPRLTAGLSDAHANVQRAARESLLQYGRVLRNPEIQRLFPLLLAALADPPNCTARCLDKIVETSFTHVVDGPSLALLEPMLVRALTDRMSSSAATSSGNTTASVQVKKRAAQIIGNLGSIIDPLELIPCLPGLTRALMAALGDPVPEVRSVAARVIGVLSKVVDKRKTRVMLDIEAACIKAVVDPNRDTVHGRIDRAGQAQAAAEIFAHSHGPTVTAGMMSGRLADGGLRPDDDRDFVAMEGFIRLVGYLPSAFAGRAQAEQLYEEAGLAALFHDILLTWYPMDPEPASMVDSWREAAERTLRLLIARYALHDPVSLFCSLCESVSDLGAVSARGRQLAWRLLYDEYLGRVFPPADRELQPDDEVPGSAAVMASECPTGEELMTLLPAASVRSLQAAAFLGRYDLNSHIRTVASGTWKALSEHPVRVVLDTLPSIVDILCASGDCDCDCDCDCDSEDDGTIGAIGNIGTIGTIGASASVHEQYIRAVEELLERMADRVCLPLLTCIQEKLALGSTYAGLIVLTTTCLQCIQSAPETGLQMTRLQQEAAVSIAIQILDRGLSASSSKPQQLECGVGLFPVVVEFVGVEGLLGRLSGGLCGLVHVRPDLVLPVILPTLHSADCLDTIEQLTAGASESMAPWAVDLMRVLFTPSSGKDGDHPTERQYRLAERLIGHCLVDQEHVMQFADLLSSVSDAVSSRLLTIYLQSHKERLFDYLLYGNLAECHHELAMTRATAPTVLLECLGAVGGDSANSYVTRILLPILNNNDVAVAVKQDAVDRLPDLGKVSQATCIALTGALIRLEASAGSKPASAGASDVNLACLKRLLLECCALLKPFHPQLVKVLVAALPRSFDCLVLLRQQLARPQLLVGELELVVGGEGETTVRRDRARALLDHSALDT